MEYRNENHTPINPLVQPTPLGDWAEQQHRKRYDRAAIKLAERTGMSLPIAQVFADLNGLGRRR
jgi:hypothetical protein